MRRFGRTIVNDYSARKYALDARFRGADHADLAGDCLSPVMAPVTGLRDASLAKLRHISAANMPERDYADGYGVILAPTICALDAQHTPINVDLAVRCRKCPNCLRARAWHWQMRAQHELASAHRTWFVTLTACPEAQFRYLSLARQRLSKQGIDFETLEYNDRYRERVRPMLDEFTRYMKRVRKTGAQLRYLLVAEAHKSGLPHLHALVHETDPARETRHRVLTSKWSDGFSTAKLTDQLTDHGAARYVTKYITKSPLARIRASQKYGDGR